MTTFTAEEIEAARKLFAGSCDFFAGTMTVERIPPEGLPEVAFAGRSNVGKSSLVNALTNRKTLARVSHTPGRTQQINFFNLGDRLALVDLPGYGYAKVSKKVSADWNDLIKSYLRGRVCLRRVCLLIDGRHGFKETDEAIMTLLDGAAVVYQIVLTKTDEVKPATLATRIEVMKAALVKHPAAWPEILATSSVTGMGIEDLRTALAEVAKLG